MGWNTFINGQQFGLWTVVSRAEIKKGPRYYNCTCQCGKTRKVRASCLSNGLSKSCGCVNIIPLIAYNKAIATGNPARKCGTLAYFKTNTWSGMRKRTINSGAKIPKANTSYIKRGCLLLMTKDEFYNWCDLNASVFYNLISNGVQPSIDRINNDLHYSLDNIQIIDFNINRTKDR